MNEFAKKIKLCGRDFEELNEEISDRILAPEDTILVLREVRRNGLRILGKKRDEDDYRPIIDWYYDPAMMENTSLPSRSRIKIPGGQASIASGCSGSTKRI